MLEKNIKNGKELRLRVKRARGEWRDTENFFGHRSELTRGFGTVEGTVGSYVPRRDDRVDGQVMPAPDLAAKDQEIGFGHPRAHRVDPDFMPQD